MKRALLAACWMMVACRPDHKQVFTLPLLDRNTHSFSMHADRIWLDAMPYTGGLFELQTNGRDTLYVSYYNMGELHGVQKKWFENGTLKELRYYVRGKKHGAQTAWWSNGKKRFAFTARNDVYDGVLHEWSEDGHLLHLATYVNGQEEGPQKMWYDNGKIRANYVIRNGKRFGLLGTKNCKNVSDSLPALH
ncbi:MAG: toxin-antitoxin system YwqK family antitoxin [Bacteroidia bacterium]|jgi:hypothetical protein